MTSATPTNQERRAAERELDEAIRRLPMDAEPEDHLPAMKRYARVVFDLAGERHSPSNQADLEALFDAVVEELVSARGEPDEWRRFGRRRALFLGERKLLRTALRQFLADDRGPYWARCFASSAPKRAAATRARNGRPRQHPTKAESRLGELLAAAGMRSPAEFKKATGSDRSTWYRLRSFQATPQPHTRAKILGAARAAGLTDNEIKELTELLTR
jgi:hypothetical protein